NPDTYIHTHTHVHRHTHLHQGKPAYGNTHTSMRIHMHCTYMHICLLIGATPQHNCPPTSLCFRTLFPHCHTHIHTLAQTQTHRQTDSHTHLITQTHSLSHKHTHWHKHTQTHTHSAGCRAVYQHRRLPVIMKLVCFLAQGWLGWGS